MKEKLFCVATLAIALASCGENSKAYKTLQEQYDSLALVNQNYEKDLSETDALVANVLANFQEISDVQSMIETNPMSGDLKKGDKERIKDNIQIIADKLQASNDALDALTKKLESVNTENKRLKQTLAMLKKEFESQKKRIAQLTEELQRKDIAIGALDSMVTTLSSNVDRLNETTAQQAANLASQDKALNKVRYCIGTSRDLKDQKLLQGGRVVTENANLDYFTEADQREISQIPLMSKHAKLLTVHPASSYELVPDGEKLLTLRINNPKAFWSNSRILVVQVD